MHETIACTLCLHRWCACMKKKTGRKRSTHLHASGEVQHLHAVLDHPMHVGGGVREAEVAEAAPWDLAAVAAAAVGRPSSTIEVAGVKNLSTKYEI